MGKILHKIHKRNNPRRSLQRVGRLASKRASGTSQLRLSNRLIEMECPACGNTLGVLSPVHVTCCGVERKHPTMLCRPKTARGLGKVSRDVGSRGLEVKEDKEGKRKPPSKEIRGNL